MPEIAYLIWRDANFGCGTPTNTMQIGDLIELHEIGYILKESDESITLTMEGDGMGDENRNWLTVPKCNIMEIHRAELADVLELMRRKRRRRK